MHVNLTFPNFGQMKKVKGKTAAVVVLLAALTAHGQIQPYLTNVALHKPLESGFER